MSSELYLFSIFFIHLRFIKVAMCGIECSFITQKQFFPLYIMPYLFAASLYNLHLPTI